MAMIAYICDGKNCPAWSNPTTFCSYVDANNPCIRTTNPKHAKYGPCDDPENHPERFEFVESGKKVKYLERVKE